MNDLLGRFALSLSSGAAMLLARLGLNMLFTAVVVRLVYYRLYRNRDYVFTYFLINLVTFSLAYLLSKVPIELGFALGLFAVFGILRYRTEAIKVRNLTYLFVVIGIALLNALANGGITLPELLIANAVTVGTVSILEAAPFSGREESTVGPLRSARSVESGRSCRFAGRSPANERTCPWSDSKLATWICCETLPTSPFTTGPPGRRGSGAYILPCGNSVAGWLSRKFQQFVHGFAMPVAST